MLLLIHLSQLTVISLKFVASVIFHIRALRHIRPLLTNDAVISVANSFVSSRLDYCISLMCNATERAILISNYNAYRILSHVLPVNLLFYRVLLVSGNLYIGYQLDNMLSTKPLLFDTKL